MAPDPVSPQTCRSWRFLCPGCRCCRCDRPPWPPAGCWPERAPDRSSKGQNTDHSLSHFESVVCREADYKQTDLIVGGEEMSLTVPLLWKWLQVLVKTGQQWGVGYDKRITLVWFVLVNKQDQRETGSGWCWTSKANRAETWSFYLVRKQKVLDIIHPRRYFTTLAR